MSDSKAVGSIEKSNLLSIIFAVKLGLWVIQNGEFRGWLSALPFFFPHIGDDKVGCLTEKAIFEAIYFL